MNFFDSPIIEYLNGFARRSWLLDNAISHFSGSDLLKGGLVISVLWAFWFSSGDEETVANTRRTIIAVFIGTFAGLFLARFLAHALPFRPRPIDNPALNFIAPFGVSGKSLKGWSSFPSDHATLFFGLALGISLVSRLIGIISIAYVFLAILIPRIFLGYHYPTDIIAGAVLGGTCVLSANGAKMKKSITGPFMKWSEKYPHWFYGLFFLFSYETADLFDHVREIGRHMLTVYSMIARGII
ncbi:MAG: phosphatase PAP2 family protein [Deltaproteobacteria bacterium]